MDYQALLPDQNGKTTKRAKLKPWKTWQLLGILILILVLVALIYGFFVRIKVKDIPALVEHGPAYMEQTLDWNSRVDDLADRLTLQEMVGLTQIAQGHLNPGIPRLGIRPFTWTNACAHADLYQAALGLAASFSSKLISEVASAIGEDALSGRNSTLSRFGFMCFVPDLNIMTDTRANGNINSLGEDPLLTYQLAENYITGLQGKGRYKRLMAGCRYMPVYDRNKSKPSDIKVSLSELYMTYLKPFKVCATAGSLAVMCSKDRLSGTPSCANYNYLSIELRHIWRYAGVVISSLDSIQEMMTSQYRSTPQDVASSAIAAGCNIELTSSLPGIYDFQLISVANKTLTEKQIRDNIKPLLYARMMLGEFDQRNSTEEYKETNPKRTHLAIKAAVKSFVLLKNENETLPLRKKYKHLVLIGPSAENIFNFSSTEIKLANDWTYIDKCNNSHCDLASLKTSDILFLTFSSYFSEDNGYDQNKTEESFEMLKFAVKNAKPGIPIIFLMFMGAPANISWAIREPRVGAILECFKPGKVTSVALYRILTNKDKTSSPAARLPFSWPRILNDMPEMSNFSMTNRTYRFSSTEALFPFGYGLSYTSFTYTNLVAPDQIQTSEDVHFNVTIINTGRYTADEVMQAYIEVQNKSQNVGLYVPKIQLVLFQRMTLKVNDFVNVTCVIPYENFSVWTGHKQGYTTLPIFSMKLYVGGQQPNQTIKTKSNVLSVQIKVIPSPQDIDQLQRNNVPH